MGGLAIWLKAAVALWLAVLVVLYFWRMILWQQMINHKKSPGGRLVGVRESTSLTDPEQYSEIGKIYRLKTMRVGQILMHGS